MTGLGFKIGGPIFSFVVSLTDGKFALLVAGVELADVEGDELIEVLRLLRDLLLAVDPGRDGKRGIGLVEVGTSSNLELVDCLGELLKLLSLLLVLLVSVELFQDDVAALLYDETDADDLEITGLGEDCCCL